MQRTVWQNFFVSRWWLIGGAVTLVFLGISVTRAVYQNYQINQEINRLRSETERLQAKKLETLDMLNYVRSSTFVQDKARSELNLLQPGEKVAVITPGLAAKTQSSRQENEGLVKSKDVGNPTKWWRYFFTH